MGCGHGGISIPRRLPATIARRMPELFGWDLALIFGIEENRPAVVALLRYAYQQGIAHRLATADEAFPTGLMTESLW